VHKVGVKKQISYQLIKMEIIGHEKMKSADGRQIYSLHLKNQCCQECNAVDYQQIFCDGWYAKHLFIDDLLIYN
jgi:hypothetical protein